MKNFREEKIQKLSSRAVKYAEDLLKLGVSKSYLKDVMIDSFLQRGEANENNQKNHINLLCEEIGGWYNKNVESSQSGYFLAQFIYDLNLKVKKQPYGIIQPPELTWLMLSLGKDHSKNVYCPYDSSSTLAIASSSVADDVVFGVHGDKSAEALNALMPNLGLEDERRSKSIEPEIEYDAALCYFLQTKRPKKEVEINGYKFESSNNTLVGLADTLSKNPDRVVAIVSHSFLTSTGVAEISLKDYVLQKNLLDKVIELPEQIIPGTRSRYSLLVLDKNRKKNQDILMLDASEGFQKDSNKNTKTPVIDWEKILKELDADKSSHLLKVPEGDPDNIFEHLDFSPKKHLSLQNYLSNNDEFTELCSIVYLLKGNPLSAAEEINNNENIENDESIFYEASIKDIGAGNILNKPEKVLKNKRRLLSKQKKLILKPNDILLSVRGSAGQVALVPEMGDEKWVSNQSFQIIRVIKDLYDPVVLFHQLLSDEVQEVIATRVSGGTLGQLKIDDLKSLPIPKIKKEKQNSIQTINANLSNLREKIQSLEKEYMEKLSELRL